MKKLRIFIILITASLLGLALFSCSSEEVGNNDNCNCRKDHYETQIEIYNGKTFIDHVLLYSEVVPCQDPIQRVETGEATYYRLLCE
jgi:hypothetical protein